MSTLQIILSIAGLITYMVAIGFVYFAFFRLRYQEKLIHCVLDAITSTLTLTMGEHLRNSFIAISEMQNQLQKLIDDDRYEEAGDLKKLLDKAEHSALRELEIYRERFGKESVDVYMTTIKKNK